MKSKLKALEVTNATTGKLHDGEGLMLDKTGDTGKWLWRYSLSGTHREMGLGAYPAVSLANAGKARDRWAAVLQGGVDPITERLRLLEAERREIERKDPTFAEVANLVFEAIKKYLRGEGERGRWFSALAVHVIPKIGGRPLSQIHQIWIKTTLSGIWTSRPATAEKAIQRIGIVFRQAKLIGLECDPFVVGQARHMLGHVPRVPTPIPSTPRQDVPALFKWLGSTPGHQSIKLLILAATRSHSVRGAVCTEIEDDIWTVPAERTKAAAGKAKPFRVPLSAAARLNRRPCAWAHLLST